MKLISYTIHRNTAPSIPDISPPAFRPSTAINDTIVSIVIQFEDQNKALNFASDMLKTIDNYRK